MSDPWIAANARPDGPEARLHAPATQRNRDAILSVLRDLLPATGTLLEVASGSGEHVVHFARALPDLIFQPSDVAPEALRSIAAWAQAEELANIRPPLALDASAAWPPTAADAILCINMLHIAPWEATLGLMRGAAGVLPKGAPLILYGPFRQACLPTASSNEAFDRSLQARDPRWGLRQVEDVAATASACGLALEDVIAMPANNLILLFRR